MASCIQKSCCNFSRFSIASTSVFINKMCLKCPQGTGLLLNAFKRKIHINSERTFSSLFTRGVCHMRPCVKWIHITRTRRGIEEFFPPGVLENPQPLPEEVKSGKGLKICFVSCPGCGYLENRGSWKQFNDTHPL